MPKQPLIVGNPVLVVVDIQEGGDMPAEEVGIAHMPGHAERVEPRGARCSRPRAPRTCRWCSSRRCTAPAASTSAASSTAPRACTASRATRHRPGTDAAARSRWLTPGVPHRQAPLLRFHRNRIRDRAARAEGVDADPHRRPDRRVRALHVRRRPPARLLRAGGRPTASAARRSTGTTPRSTRWSTCRPVPYAPPTKSSPPSRALDTNHDPVLEGAAR